MTGDIAAFSLDAGDALFIDFDGTLAELGPDPDAIHIAPETGRALSRVSERLHHAVAVLSGRDIRDLAPRVPQALWRAGGHGLEVLGPGESPEGRLPPPEDAVLDALRTVGSEPGVRLELKGPIVAVHYRAAPEAAGAVREAAARAADAAPGHVVQHGHMVVEVKPAAADKGRTLRAMMERPSFAGRRPVMIGDDATDEDAIAVALELGGIGVWVGAGDSRAGLRAANPAAVRAWLRREAGDE